MTSSTADEFTKTRAVSLAPKENVAVKSKSHSGTREPSTVSGEIRKMPKISDVVTGDRGTDTYRQAPVADGVVMLPQHAFSRSIVSDAVCLENNINRLVIYFTASVMNIVMPKFNCISGVKELEVNQTPPVLYQRRRSRHDTNFRHRLKLRAGGILIVIFTKCPR